MNKEHWLTVILDGSVSKEKVFALLDESYDLTK
jgi:predicted DNA-binding protein (MmcQ/YjbR family)